MWDKLKNVAYRISEIALCLVRKWWRPLGSLGLSLAIAVNTIYLPLKNNVAIDLTAFALVIGAWAPLAAVRAWENHKAASNEA